MNRLLLTPPSLQCCMLRGYSSGSQLKKTFLHDLHVRNGGKMVPFAGFSMPVQYSDLSIGDSAKHTRSHVSIFDVSHMLQTEIRGKHREQFMESLTTADIDQLSTNTGALSVFTNEKGGILDDLILSKTDDDSIYVVTNAECIDKDLPYLQENSAKWRQKGKDVEVNVLEDRGLIAVQGPEMVKLLESQTDVDLSKLYFMHTTVGTVCGVKDCRVTRCGYTGEDGVEISVPGEKIAMVVEQLLSSQAAVTKLAGLGARDALRIEAGLCLYGNDIREDTTPVEAAKRRRQTLGFPGAEKIVEQLEKKNYPKRRVGLSSQSGRAPRGHLPISDPINQGAVGFVTSGCPSPNLGINIAMGYVDAHDAQVGKVLNVDFGGKTEKVTVTKLPFVQSRYYMASKKK
ncbi:aminomethyltransferase folate-binding domain-containing protein [Ditylenchus destructor]|uniref:Aminomethyltransferase n=1 Tax=Ditylenchus destructor TaxID=166010 RepID=A0AAD4RA83_9BILA|nr:aminomethyltransferase folate-binding domain-containing protein [Ditylenchus destructor]